jgi:23S rRNA pseudouridine1911/1915/1917 synthase
MTPRLDILYEDNHCLAVAKPAPLLTQAPPDVPSLEQIVRDYIKTKYNKPGRVYLGIPHRLDRPVTGVVLFARQTVSAQRLADQFRQRQVSKVYWAVVEGVVEPKEGQWQDYLLKVSEEARAERAEVDTPGAKLAQLDYDCLAVTSEWSLLEFRPRTGRMHQLRVQSALRGHPIWGDRWYGSHYDFGQATESSRDRIIALHARSLTFLHPVRYEPVTVVAPLSRMWCEAFPLAGECERETASGVIHPSADPPLRRESRSEGNR